MTVALMSATGASGAPTRDVYMPNLVGRVNDSDLRAMLGRLGLYSRFRGVTKYYMTSNPKLDRRIRSQTPSAGALIMPSTVIEVTAWTLRPMLLGAKVPSLAVIHNYVPTSTILNCTDYDHGDECNNGIDLTWHPASSVGRKAMYHSLDVYYQFLDEGSRSPQRFAHWTTNSPGEREVLPARAARLIAPFQTSAWNRENCLGGRVRIEAILSVWSKSVWDAKVRKFKLAQSVVNVRKNDPNGMCD